MKLKLEGFGLLVKDMGAMIRFYRDAAGECGHFEIALGAEDYGAVDRAFEEAVLKGAKAVMAPVTEPWGQRTCYIADPEGNLVEIGSFNPGK